MSHRTQNVLAIIAVVAAFAVNALLPGTAAPARPQVQALR